MLTKVTTASKGKYYGVLPIGDVTFKHSMYDTIRITTDVGTQ